MRVTDRHRGSHGSRGAVEDGSPPPAPRAMAPATLQLSVAIPCYDEEAIVREHVGRILVSLRSLGVSFELLLCDDASTDGTAQILDSIDEPEVRVVHHRRGPSRRENLALTLREACGAIVAFMDMDLSSGLDRMPELLGAVADGRCDVAIGSRNLPSSRTERSALRRIYSWAYNSALRAIFGSTVRDHQCGFKAMRRETFLALTEVMGYDSSFRRGWFWDAELLIRAQILGLEVLELPVVWIAGRKSSFRFTKELRLLPRMLRLRAVVGRVSRSRG